MKYWFRNCIYLSALVLALPWLLLRRWKSGRYRQGSCQKLLGLRPGELSDAWPADCLHAKETGATIWFHGVSVGEVQLLAPLIRQLQRHQPASYVVLSTTTDSGMKLARQLLPDIPNFYFPFDFSWAVRATLRALRPTKLVLAELELWPNLIDLAHEAGIPLIVVNGRLSDKSFRRYQSIGFLTHNMFSKLSHVVAQSEPYAERFRACGCRPEQVTVSGSLKFDNVHFERNAPQVDQLRKLVGIEPLDRILVVGSTQSPEEMTSCQAYLRLREHWPRLKLIVVPRHPDRFDEVYQSISNLPAKFHRRSRLLAPIRSEDWEILLVDTVGELRWWWGLAEVAIVGGSFGERGGQNMLEPAAYGANVAFGPNTSNFKDIAEQLIAGQAAERIPNLESVENWISQQLQSPQPGRLRGQRAREIISSQQGATDRTLEVLLDHRIGNSILCEPDIGRKAG